MEIRKTEAGIDWFECTLPAGASARPEMEFAYKVSECATRCAGREDRERFGFFGYRGWRQGTIVYGERDTGSYARASGPLATDLALAMGTEGVHVARMDVQTTVWFDQDNTRVAEDFAYVAVANREAGLIKANTRINLRQGFGHGDTAYIGSSKSDRMLRVYDKGRESGEERYRHAWRFEVQLRNEPATECFRRWKEAGSGEGFLAQVVAGYLIERGLSSFRHMGYWGAVSVGIRSLDRQVGKVLRVAGVASCPHRPVAGSLRLR